MRSLKSALGKEENDLTSSKVSESNRILRNNNSQSMWSIGEGLDEQDNKNSNENTKMMVQITQILKYSSKNDGLAQTTIPKILSSYQKVHGNIHKEKQSLQSIQKIVKKMLLKTNDMESELEYLSEMLKKRIKKLEKREEKYAMEFDQIAEKLFKKPQQNKKLKENKKKKVLQINLQSDFQSQPRRKHNKNHDSNGNSNGTKNSGSGSQDSGDKKLGKLLSSGYPEKEGSLNKNEQYTAEGYNFSAVMSSSLAVKQRNPKNQKLIQQMVPKKSKKKIEKNNESSEGEDAFIFYRPGKDKK